MEHTINTTALQESSVECVRPGRAFRALRKSISKLREAELNLYTENPRSPLAIRLANVRGELNRIRLGEPVRIDVLTRSITGIRDLIPLRDQRLPERVVTGEGQHL